MKQVNDFACFSSRCHPRRNIELAEWSVENNPFLETIFETIFGTRPIFQDRPQIIHHQWRTLKSLAFSFYWLFGILSELEKIFLETKRMLNPWEKGLGALEKLLALVPAHNRIIIWVIADHTWGLDIGHLLFFLILIQPSWTNSFKVLRCQ